MVLFIKTKKSLNNGCFLRYVQNFARTHVCVSMTFRTSVLSSLISLFRLLSLFSYKQTWCSQGCSTKTFVINYIVNSSFPPNLQNAFTLKPLELVAQTLREYSPLPPSLPPHVTCHMSHVMGHMSCVTFVSSFDFLSFCKYLVQVSGGVCYH